MKENMGSKTTSLRQKVDGVDDGGRGREREAGAEERVVKEGLDVVDDEEGGGEEVEVGEGGVVKREVGGGVVGDEDGFGGKEGREAGAAREEEEVGEGEVLGDDVIRRGSNEERRCMR
ncbi:hypothetical protein V8G54_036401 [Vigna mungo]|uniref:Uncharacterized protein n=1 Tax=Vigna mungo TaxID=3915 RepID=A0AAQ3MH11_VIGMU